MPLFEYNCQKCNYKEEVLEKKASKVKSCPKCKKKTLKRVYSGSVGLVFKGSGFYSTDYK